MTVDKELIAGLLRDALVALALPKPEQVRVTHPGCVTCDLIEDFTHGRLCFVQSCSDRLDESSTSLLAQIDSTIDDLTNDDCVCFDSAMLDRPPWASLRALATDALDALGWADAKLDAYTETEPGVWRRGNSAIVDGSDVE
ncbi:hypothetical protein [Rhodopirellula bahusiensis]|uniref:Uncharacterized protein n=1 Tax=Rhodopirellula bahusiensis TaxID=2014065 RepID=A0A2G1WCR7_9BACT|nr:hypothetical protein [Rhodopirellula bahusiensis]PHQ36837.1 hypothetical protein CEE69_00030 [Rhodopirellula bahusiensis]